MTERMERIDLVEREARYTRCEHMERVWVRTNRHPGPMEIVGKCTECEHDDVDRTREQHGLTD